MKSTIKRAMKALLRRREYELLRSDEIEEWVHAHHTCRVLDRYKVDLVLDVGANLGQFYGFLRGVVGYAGQIVSFEPIQEFRDALEARCDSDTKWRIVPCALGSKCETRTITQFSSPGLSSLLSPDLQAMGKMLPGGRPDIVSTQSIDVRRLDELWTELVAHGVHRPNVFLKVDTQGFDLEVLKGLGERSSDVCCIQTELSYKSIYHDAPAYSEVMKYLTDAGYELSGMFPVTLDGRLAAIEFDGLFVNSRAHID